MLLPEPAFAGSALRWRSDFHSKAGFPSLTLLGREHGDSLDAQLATITTDTGSFAPGRRDFSRYDTPTFCLVAADNALAVARHSLSAQAIQDTMAMDTIGLGVVGQMARTCIMHLAQMPPTSQTEWEDGFQLAVYQQDDSLARAQLTSHPDSWVAGMTWYLSRARLAAAQALISQADTKGSSRTRLALHNQLRVFYQATNTASSHTQEKHEDSVLIQLGLQSASSPSDRGFIYVWDAYQDLMRLAVLEDTTRLPELAAATLRDLGHFSAQEKPKNWDTFTAKSLLKQLTPDWYSHLSFGGERAPQVQADFWWQAPGTSTHTTAVPVAGKVNLICAGGELSNSDERRTAGWLAPYLRRWVARYQASGLVVTVLRAATGGAFYWYPPMLQSTHVTVSDSADEAHFWQWYDQTYHQLPVTVAVKVVRTVQWLPAPDGRRLIVSDDGASHGYADLVGQATTTVQFGRTRTACTLVGRDGTVLYVEGKGGETPNWKRMEEALAWLFASEKPRQ